MNQIHAQPLSAIIAALPAFMAWLRFRPIRWSCIRIGGGVGVSVRVEHELYFFLHTFHIAELTGWLQLGVPGIREGEYDVEVFGIGEIIEESEDANDVQPPANPLNGVQSFG